jgi:ankyrin repeat protein
LASSLVLVLSGCDRPSPQTTATTAGNTTVEKTAAPVEQAAAPEAANVVASTSPEPVLQQPPTKDDAGTADERKTRERAAGAHSLSTQAPADRAVNQTGPIVVKAEPANLDLGDVSAGEAGVGTIKLVNTGEKPMKLIECKSSCGCTSPNCPRGRELAVGESVDIDVRMQAGQHAGPMNKTVTIIVEGQSPLLVPVKCNVITLLAMEPAELNPDTQDGHIKIKSTDGTPFRITGMTPVVIDSFDTEPKAEHEIVMDWAKWKEIPGNLKVVFHTDHPKAKQIQAKFEQGWLREWAKERQQRGQSPDRLATLPQTKSAAPSLLGAAQAGDLEKVKTLYANEGAKGERDQTGGNALMLSSEAGKIDVVKFLLESGVNVNELDNAGRTALSRAALKNQGEVVKTLLAAKADVNLADKTGGSPLAWACGFAKLDVVQALLDAGAKPDVANVTGTTPLMWAAGFGDPESVKLLISKGVDLNIQDTTPIGATPLIYAARQGQLDSLKVLIAAGAKVNASDKNGRTPLAWAATTVTNPVEKIEALLAAGADANAKDKDGLTALDYGRTRLDGNMDSVLQVLSKVTAAPEATSKAEGQPAGSGIN